MYHQDLLDQADQLVCLGGHTSKQVDLRRAVSATYYAVFHYLVDTACKSQLDMYDDSKPHRRILARAFNHGKMMKACEQFKKEELQSKLCKGLSSSYVSQQEVRYLARTFVDLQKERHRADYDFVHPFYRNSVLGLIRQTREAITDFPDDFSVANVERDFFLACLWAVQDIKE